MVRVLTVLGMSRSLRPCLFFTGTEGVRVGPSLQRGDGDPAEVLGQTEVCEI